MKHTAKEWRAFLQREPKQYWDLYILDIVEDLQECESLIPKEPEDHEHIWGTDGQHQNEFCKICFVDSPHEQAWKAQHTQR